MPVNPIQVHATSVTTISGVVARNRRLLLNNESKHSSESWRNDADKLLSGLEFINSSLKSSDAETKQSEHFVKLEREIVQLSYEIDDAIIAAVELGSSSKTRVRITAMFVASGSASDKSSKAADLQSLRTQLENIIRNFESETKAGKHNNITSLQGQMSCDLAYPGSPGGKAPAGEDVPRMENQVSSALLKEHDLPVVCILGNSGMGKTTLAKKAFYDSQVRKHFKGFAWVTINQDFQTKNVLQAIMLQLLPDRKVDMREMDEIDLTQQIFDVQKEKRCLIVLEDVEGVQDWRSIRVAFPIGHSNSKILMTTTSRLVAEDAQG